MQFAPILSRQRQKTLGAINKLKKTGKKNVRSQSTIIPYREWSASRDKGLKVKEVKMEGLNVALYLKMTIYDVIIFLQEVRSSEMGERRPWTGEVSIVLVRKMKYCKNFMKMMG
jgi:hypothetical protein